MSSHIDIRGLMDSPIPGDERFPITRPAKSLDGVSLGMDIHNPADMEFRIVADKGHEVGRFRVGDVTPEAVKRAAKEASRMPVPQNPERSIDVIRTRYADTTNLLIESIKQKASTGAMGRPHRQTNRKQQAAQSQGQSARRMSPLSALNTARTEVTRAAQDEQHEHPQYARAAQTVNRRPPQPIAVKFERPHFGQLTAYYHDVIVEEDFVVLVFLQQADDFSPQYFPEPAVDQNGASLPMAMHVLNSREVFGVQPTHVRYDYAGCTHCLLMITERQFIRPAGVTPEDEPEDESEDVQDDDYDFSLTGR